MSIRRNSNDDIVKKTIASIHLQWSSRFILCALLLLLGTSLISQRLPHTSANMLEHEGIRVTFSPQHVDSSKAGQPFRIGDDVRFRFEISDMLTETGLSGVFPAAWVDPKSEAEDQDKSCVDKVGLFIEGSILQRADLDLNVYHVVVMNGDATLTVVDPLFGFGGSQLLALVELSSVGLDWSLTNDQSTIYVTQPDSGKVAVVSTHSWSVAEQIDIGERPLRALLQPDQRYLWVTYTSSNNTSARSGIAVIDTRTNEVIKKISTGRGWHELSVTPDNQYLFCTNMDEGTISVIDIRELALIKNISTGSRPFAIDYSTAANAMYVAHKSDGGVAVIDIDRLGIRKHIEAPETITRLRFAPGGRYAIIVDPSTDKIHILDAANNRIIQSGTVEDQPDNIFYSDELAYIRHRGSPTIYMIPLDQIGEEGQPIQVIDFPGGQEPAGLASLPSPADGIIQAPGATAVLVANPADKTIYYYKEGMAAPMGTFSNYKREARAVLVVDRSLRERGTPGVYETTGKIRSTGTQDVAFFMDVPRLYHCFDLEVEEREDEAILRLIENYGPLLVDFLPHDKKYNAGAQASIQFRMIDPHTMEPVEGLEDVMVLCNRSGIWHQRKPAEETAEKGIYEVTFPLNEAGYYNLYIQCLSKGLTFSNPQFLVLQADE